MTWLTLLVALLCVGGNALLHLHKRSVTENITDSELNFAWSVTENITVSEFNLSSPIHPGVQEPDEASQFPYVTETNGKDLVIKCPRKFGIWPLLDSCSHYVRCDEGQPIVYSCPEQLHYNPTLKECDIPQRVSCPYECRSPDEDFPLVGDCESFIECTVVNRPILRVCKTGHHWSKYTHHCELAEIADCPFKCLTENGTFPYVDDCSSYIVCQYGKAQVMKCPQDLYFSMTSYTCVPKSMADCPLQFQCEGRTGQFPVLADCRMYYHCNENQDGRITDVSMTLHVCPSGLLYNSVKGECDERRKAVCANQCPQPNGIFSIPYLCKYFMICRDNEADIHMCPDSLHFNPIRQECDLPERSGCDLKCPEANMKMGVPQQCNAYVQCIEYVPEIKFCPAHLYWNDLLKMCDDPVTAGCKFNCPQEYGIFPNIGQCENYFLCDHGVSYMKSCPRGLHYNRRTKTCDFPKTAKCRLTCPQPDGNFPVDGDCSLYIHCSKSNAVIEKCEENLNFDHTNEQCSTLNNVKCRPECPAPNGRFTFPGNDEEMFLECTKNISVLRSCSSGLIFDAMNETCA